MNWLIFPLLLLKNRSEEERKKVFAQLVPLALPVPQATRLAFATIELDREARRQAVVEQNLVTEAVKAANITSADALTAFPALNAAFNKLPASVKSGIFNPAVVGPAGDREVVLSPTADSGTPAPAPARGRPTNQPATRPTP